MNSQFGLFRLGTEKIFIAEANLCAQQTAKTAEVQMQENSLIEKYLPEYTFNEKHEIVVNSSIENVYAIAKDFDLSKSKMILFLFKIRGLPTKRMNLRYFINDMGFTHLEERYPYETLVGFWSRFKIARIPCYEDFIQNSISPWIKVVWNFAFEKIAENKTKAFNCIRIRREPYLLRCSLNIACIRAANALSLGLLLSLLKRCR